MFSWYKYLIVSLVFSHLGFWSGSLFLIAPFPDLCLLVLFYLEREREREREIERDRESNCVILLPFCVIFKTALSFNLKFHGEQKKEQYFFRFQKHWVFRSLSPYNKGVMSSILG